MSENALEFLNNSWRRNCLKMNEDNQKKSIENTPTSCTLYLLLHLRDLRKLLHSFQPG